MTSFQITGIHNGHTVIYTITRGETGSRRSSNHSPTCPCKALDNRPARITRRRKQRTA